MYPLYENARRFMVEVARKRKALIVPHLMADVDALASAYVMANILKRRGVDVGIYISSLSETSSPAMFNHIVKSGFLGKTGGIVIVVDTSSKNFVPELVKNPFAVIDHHYGVDKLNARIELIDKEALSTTEVIWKLFGKEVTKKEALFLAAGLYSDAFGLPKLTLLEHLETFTEMLKKAGIGDLSIVKKIALKIPSIEEKQMISDSLRSIETLKVGKYLVAYLFHDSPWAVEIADLLANTGLYDGVFVVRESKIIHFRAGNVFSKEAMELIKETIKELEAKGGMNNWRGVIRLPKPLSREKFKKILRSKLELLNKK